MGVKSEIIVHETELSFMNQVWNCFQDMSDHGNIRGKGGVPGVDTLRITWAGHLFDEEKNDPQVMLDRMYFTETS